MASSSARSCDACYTLKAKCVYSAAGAGCNRCRRLSRLCVTERPVRQSGRPKLLPTSIQRKPLRSNGVESKTKCEAAFNPQQSLSPFGAGFKNFTPDEQFMIARFVEPSTWTAFMVSPRVGPRMHQEALHSFLNSYGIVGNGFFSMYGAISTATSHQLPGMDVDVNITRGNAALQTFRTISCPIHVDDFAPWLWLGISIIVYARCAVDTSASPVRRYMLTHLTSLGTSGLEYRRHPVVLALTALDVLDCLMNDQTPVVNVRDDMYDALDADGFLGMCFPLVQFAHELCDLADQMRRRSRELVHKQPGQDQRLLDIETRIKQWQPKPVSTLIHTLAATDTVHTLTLVRVHKLMLLLHIHRLKYTPGMQDEVARLMAESILSDLDLCHSSTGSPTHWASVPFIHAAVEITEPKARERTVNKIPIHVDPVSSRHCRTVRVFIEAAWQSRDSRVPPFDATSRLPALCIYT